ncbi:biotin--[acetyl-CoA-carboxylase] ligase [Candidatus Woesearchaeota archaeon]|nr:biotin--[acetyl-CoA-carboxylase] ligase [Candidatus Woesearchaeota archaeon]
MYKIFRFKSLTSTQDKAKEFSKKGLSDIVVVAGVQTKGIGRFKRKWHSGKGGLWMSILLKPKSIKNSQYLTFIAAISVAESIQKISKLKTNIKWPNDVHYKRKKLCGILTDGIFGKDNFIAVGIGLNVNQNKFPREISNTATSLNLIKHRAFSIKKLLDEITNKFFYLYENYYIKNKLEYILNSWKKYSDTIGKNVIVATRTKKIYGKAIGIDKNCNLLLRQKKRRITKIIEGDITVRH